MKCHEPVTKAEIEEVLARLSMDIVGGDYEAVALYIKQLEQKLAAIEHTPTMMIRFVGETPVDTDVTKGGGWRECHLVPVSK